MLLLLLMVVVVVMAVVQVVPVLVAWKYWQHCRCQNHRYFCLRHCYLLCQPQQ
jgi:hypothetical protein